jgi:hypothetical protein
MSFHDLTTTTDVSFEVMCIRIKLSWQISYLLSHLLQRDLRLGSFRINLTPDAPVVRFGRPYTQLVSCGPTPQPPKDADAQGNASLRH